MILIHGLSKYLIKTNNLFNVVNGSNINVLQRTNVDNACIVSTITFWCEYICLELNFNEF